MPAPCIPSWPSGSRSARATSPGATGSSATRRFATRTSCCGGWDRSTTKRPGHVAMLLENQPELLALYGGCGYAGLTLFGVNTGLRGETLAGVINQSRARVLVVDERFLPEVERIRSKLEHVATENLLVLREPAGAALGAADLEECLAVEVAKPGESLDTPAVKVGPENNLMVIYTSGTTGLPKGINNNHFKLLVIGLTVSRTPRARAGRRRLRLHAAVPLQRDVPRLPARLPRGRDPLDARALQRQQLRPGRPALRRQLLELRGRAGPLHPRRDREGVRGRRGAHPARGRAATRATGCATRSATAPRRPTSTVSCAGSRSRTCSSSTARPRPRSAPSAGRATRGAASARSPTRP